MSNSLLLSSILLHAMDSIEEDQVNKTIFNTPKPTATSTVDRKSYERKHKRHTKLDNCLEVPPLESMDISREQASCKSILQLSNMSCDLQYQRNLAESSLQRVNKVTGIPSKYFKPPAPTANYETLKQNDESTVNESDLLRTPTNTSTPKNSIDVNNLRESMAELSYKIIKSDISINNFPKEFEKALEATQYSIQEDSNMFKPAEEVRSLLLSDELSWYKHNEMPIVGEQFSNLQGVSNVSIGDFFLKKSNTLSDLAASHSPDKDVEPIPLISFNSEYNMGGLDFSKIDSEVLTDKQNANDSKSHKQDSLSVSAIQRFLAETEDTPKKVVDYLLNYAKSSIPSKLNQNSHETLTLPLSKNSSYTSDHSDNEALQHIANKENIDYLNVNKSVGSRSSSQVSKSRSSSSSSTITSLPNGKLPIDTSKSELIWGCVKIDKCVTVDFILRNRCARKLGLQMSVSGHEYKIRKDNRSDSELYSSSKILLHPYEAKNIIVSFTPTRIGAAVDELVFRSLDPNLQQTSKQYIRLFGYGGHNKIEFHDLTRDRNEKFWLSFGKFNNSMLQKTFTVKNIGTLPSFVYITYNANENFNVFVTPFFFTLIPEEQKQITVTYKPKLEDHSTLLRSTNLVADLGSLSITSGAEVTRGRLRRLCRKNVEKGLKVDRLSNALKENIKGEVMPSDLSRFRESADTLERIVRLLDHNEVILTIERDPDQTIIPNYMEDSGVFHSLCHDTTVANLENTMVQNNFLLEPTMIYLVPPRKAKDCLFLRSNSSRSVYYQAMSHPEGLEIDPKEGSLAPGNKVILNLALRNIPHDDISYKICVYIENEILEADVKVALTS